MDTEDMHDDEGVTDLAYDPVTGESAVWLQMIDEAEQKFRDYQAYCDGIDTLYADLNRLATVNRDREFQLFWSNIEVIKPSIYSRPPVPVVVPRFKDRRPLYRASSELIERACVTAFDMSNIDYVMRLVRDDLCISARGTPWVRYESKADVGKSASERTCIEHVYRRDFLHEPCRNWSEVGWVARRCWMTQDEMRKRFREHSGDAYYSAALEVMRHAHEDGAATGQLKCAVWEIWSKADDKVVWVTDGVPVTLDEGKPHLKLEGFFPCPMPAYATVQNGTLIPIPDVLFYKDQLEEINQLTNRIHSLSLALKIRGFIPSGGEVGDALETAINMHDDSRIIVPVANWAAFGGTSAKIEYLPIEMIAATVAGLIELRRSVIEDVYQIMGISDIMRGSTQKDETLGAQELKAQFGSVRIRDKQAELVRVACDLVRIVAEIMAEHFSKKTLLDMSQLELPTDAEIARQVSDLKKKSAQITKDAEQQAKQINQQVQAAMSDPQMMQMAQQNPEKAQEAQQQAQASLQKLQQDMQKQTQQIIEEIGKLDEQPTIEEVMEFLRDNKMRPFVLDIETDSTIAADEQSEKQSRNEFVQALGGMIQQFAPVIMQQPAMAPMVGELIKFALAPYRAGRELEGKIDEAIEQLVQQSSQPRPNPEQQAMEAEQARAQAEMQMEQQRMQFEAQKIQADQQAKMQELQMKATLEEARLSADLQGKQMDAQNQAQEHQARLQQMVAQEGRDAEKHIQDMQKGQLEIQKLELAIAAQAQAAKIAAENAAQQANLSERSFEQQTQMAKEKADQSKGKS